MRILSFLVATGIALAAGSHAADAGSPTFTDRLWSVTGNTCNVADESAGLYDTRGAGVGFLTGKIGTIRLYCPIYTSWNNGSTHLFGGLGLSYNHPVLNGANATISALLRKIDDGSNSATTLCTASSTNTGLDQTYCSSSTTTSQHTTYYVQVDLTRTSTNVDPEFLAVYLYY